MAGRTRIFEIDRPDFRFGLVIGYSKGVADSQRTAASSPTVQPQTTAPEMRDITTSTVGSAATATFAPDSWSLIIGRYKDDPTWKEFGEFLKQYRKKANRVYSHSTD